MKKEFSKREWIMLIIVVSLIQAVIWYISYIHSGNNSALSYVSFSGTIISIILALLAIGYTYGDSINQKNKTDSVSTQIALLSDVVKNISLESKSLSQISTISDKLKELATNWEAGIEQINQTKCEVSSVSESIRGLINENTSSNKIDISPFNLNKKEVAKNFMSARNPLMEICVLLIMVAEGKEYNHNSELVDCSVKKFINRAVENSQEKPHSQIDNLIKLFSGAFLTCLAILFGLGLINGDQNEYIVTSELKEVVKETTLTKPQAAGPFYNVIREEIVKELQSIKTAGNSIKK